MVISFLAYYQRNIKQYPRSFASNIKRIQPYHLSKYIGTNEFHRILQRWTKVLIAVCNVCYPCYGILILAWNRWLLEIFSLRSRILHWRDTISKYILIVQIFSNEFQSYFHPTDTNIWFIVTSIWFKIVCGAEIAKLFCPMHVPPMHVPPRMFSDICTSSHLSSKYINPQPFQ